MLAAQGSKEESKNTHFKGKKEIRQEVAGDRSNDRKKNVRTTLRKKCRSKEDVTKGKHGIFGFLHRGSSEERLDFKEKKKSNEGSIEGCRRTPSRNAPEKKTPSIVSPDPPANIVEKKSTNQPLFEEGESVCNQKNTWLLRKILGHGAYGWVYKVINLNNEENVSAEYAMKIEPTDRDSKELKLKQEVWALSKCWDHKEPAIEKRHFLELIDSGSTRDCKFMVMTLVGPALSSVLSKHFKAGFPKDTALNAAIQTFESIYDLHQVGFLHRDIKPHNFAIGVGAQESVIFIMDFGNARYMFKPGTRIMRPARKNAPFRGSMRYAPRATHYGLELGRMDDLESWLYMVFQMFDQTNGIPWKMKPPPEVVALKEQFFKHELHQCYTSVPKPMKEIADIINSTNYVDEPRYSDISTILKNIGKTHNINWENTPDWVGCGKANEKKSYETERILNNPQKEESKTPSEHKVTQRTSISTNGSCSAITNTSASTS